MNPARRAWLMQLALGAAGGAACGAPAHAAHATPADATIRRGRPLVFPGDHGAHVGVRTEWWYVTGWLEPDWGTSRAAVTGDAGEDALRKPSHGFQITFFRSRLTGTGAGTASAPASPRADPPGRFAPRHLLFAHAAVTDLATDTHLNAQRIGRWNGEPKSGPDRAAVGDADVRLGRWQLTRDASSPVAGSRWSLRARSERIGLQGTFQARSPPLLQGDAGFSRKGPEETQASHYYSLPQLDARLTIELNGQALATRGRAWLDHEWSEELMHPEAVGWDWIGINLFDGSALTAFRLRRADGSVLWAGGSLRDASARAAVRAFAPADVRFEAGRLWRSAATNAEYPVAWEVVTPAGRHAVRALVDAQELDSRSGTGAVYWEGLAELLDDGGQRVGLGYLEMTGYAAPVKLN